jgi:hypothetical protein
MDLDRRVGSSVVDVARCRKMECMPSFRTPSPVGFEFRFVLIDPRTLVLTSVIERNDAYFRDRCVNVRSTGINRAVPLSGLEVRIRPAARVSIPSTMKRTG